MIYLSSILSIIYLYHVYLSTYLPAAYVPIISYLSSIYRFIIGNWLIQ